MPIKWSTYRILLILYMMLSLAMIIIFILSQTKYDQGNQNKITGLITILLTVALFFNGFINYLWLHYYYPDRLPSKALRRITRIFQWTALPVLLLFGFFSISSLYAFFEAQLSIIGRNVFYIMATMTMLLLFISGLITFILQLSLSKTIKRNQKAAFEDFMQ